MEHSSLLIFQEVMLLCDFNKYRITDTDTDTDSDTDVDSNPML